MATQVCTNQNIELHWPLYSHIQYLMVMNSLIDPFSEEEIKLVVFNLAKSKSVGPDEFPSYSRYRDIIKTDVFKLFDAFFNSPIGISTLNYTCISLIPKMLECTSIKDFQPISLENGMIKIISKVLATRLRQ